MILFKISKNVLESSKYTYKSYVLVDNKWFFQRSDIKLRKCRFRTYCQISMRDMLNVGVVC